MFMLNVMPFITSHIIKTNVSSMLADISGEEKWHYIFPALFSFRQLELEFFQLFIFKVLQMLIQQFTGHLKISWI